MESNRCTRRTWLKSSVSALAGWKISQAGGAEEAWTVVDAHTHFYDPDRPQGVPWPVKDSPLYRPVLPADWRAVAAPCGIGATIVIEASPWLEDNQWVLDLAAHESAIVAFIGNLDFAAADFSKHLARFAANPLFRGLRARSTRLSEELVQGARALAERGLSLDLNGPAGFVADAVALSLRLPDLRIIVDHVGAAGDARTLSQQWKDDIRRAADAPNVFVKVSGFVEQIDGPPGAAPQDLGAYMPILDHLWQSFGEDRLIFGSNWPVSERGTSYQALFNIVREFFAAKGVAASAKYFRGNSLAAYRWRERAR